MFDDRFFDAIVVGSGASGAWVAKELTERGLQVLVLEAGRAIVPDIDTPRPPPSESPLAMRVAAAISGQYVQSRCPALTARTRPFFVDDRDLPYTRPADARYNWFRGRQVGGRLHQWARVVMRMSDYEFKAASRDGAGVDWPLAYADLAPHYDAVERFIGVRGAADGIAALPDGAFREPMPLTVQEIAFRDAVERAYPDRRVIAARVADHDPGPLPAMLCAAQRTGALTLASDAVVRRVDIDEASGLARGVSYVARTGRRSGSVRASAVVLCAGTVETVRLLLNSACARHPQGVGNSGGRLGRGLVDHLLVGVAGPLPDSGALPAAPGDPYDFGTATGIYLPRFRNVERAHPAFRRGYAIQGGLGRGRHWYLLAHGEMEMRDENFIAVDRQRSDVHGIPIAHLACRHSPNDNAMIADAQVVLHEIARAAGLPVRAPPSGRFVERVAYAAARPWLLAPSGAFLPGSAMHELGGAAMGETPATSVTNRWGQCWDARNVVVADGACFPSGCSQNVTLTIMALAARAAAHLADALRDGRL